MNTLSTAIPLDSKILLLHIIICFFLRETQVLQHKIISRAGIHQAQYKFLCEIQNPAWSDPRQQSPLTRPAAAIRH